MIAELDRRPWRHGIRRSRRHKALACHELAPNDGARPDDGQSCHLPCHNNDSDRVHSCGALRDRSALSKTPNTPNRKMVSSLEETCISSLSQPPPQSPPLARQPWPHLKTGTSPRKTPPA